MLVHRIGGAVLGALVLSTALVRVGSAQSNSGSEATVNLGGYVRSLTGFQDLGYDPIVTDRRVAFNGEVIRLKWLLDVGGWLRLNVHNRLQFQYSSSGSGGGRDVLGFGVSAVPGRSIDLETILVDEDHLRVWHDLDRLAVSIYSDVVDLTIGRQAVTWGISNLFPIADLWAQFSPFELDTEEKPGLDAIRALMYPAEGIELDAVIADRGAARDLSAAIRATIELPVADVYVGAGKFWRELMGLAGASFVVDKWKLRGEIGVPWEIDDENVRRIRTTIGADWVSSSVVFSLEYHHNGLGSNQSEQYAGQLATAEFARSETYYLGRHMLGALVSYRPSDRLSLAASSLMNLGDPSIALTPSVVYDFGQNTRVSVGSLLSFGSTPQFSTAAPPQFQSEFGTYGDFVYTQVSVYF